ncbi:protein, SNF2 family [Dictyocaulus viviparus]|uniref:Protein, SNF2 family n=1 Tax=Dictyocaulus viviparus TaxID=29172 RepID=A0A0D8XQM4_DICVI|nr:protein, SNF2 family [Dictyocaulus viviparus]
MPVRRVSHSSPVDVPSTSRETRGDSDARGDESYLQYIMRLLRVRRTCREFIERREKMGPGIGNSTRSRTFQLNSLLAELEFGISEEMMKAEIFGSPRCMLTPRSNFNDRNTASSGALSPIEVKVEDSHEPTGTSHSLLSTNTTESNVEKAAKQEAQVMMRIAELRRSGLWTANRLPLCVEPPRNKTHWDYVLEEMKWMATDFRMERQFKRNVARKIAAAIQKQKKDDETDQERAQMRFIRDGKRICASIAKMVRDFWQTVDKVVEHRAQEILESKKRKALDAHMAFIVGEADKLSSMVHERLSQERGASKTPSIVSHDNGDEDGDFCVSEFESDDEVTIEREEAAMQQDETEDVQQELSALNKDADQDMDDLLASLPPEYLASIGVQLPSSSNDSVKSSLDPPNGEYDNKSRRNSDSIFNDKNRKRNDESIEGNKAKRLKLEEASDEDFSLTKKSGRMRISATTTKAEENESIEDGSKLLECRNLMMEGSGDGRGMLESVDYAKLNSDDSNERQQELANIAEAALKFQPKGFTLETTHVKTAVPFLVRGTLREYQMVGLDWLVTLYEKNLNGILADEMGLGKTIQTIALLAHLACCESVWGPHLIVVPTSVILNWEMELKKWCPAFKILTYFGSQKDRMEKRKGWSKPNAFHVCVTSYKTITTDIRAFKMKAWQYLILDEAQNIKNWKSQRWQTLLNVKARRRLLLTGTPLQNSLMELWSLMHFLMPAIFASHDDFKDWFSNPITGMMDGSIEFSSTLVQQLHKVLRPFILRRLKSEVEKQLPKKTEHVIKCPLSKRQRYLYDDFMSQRSTRDKLVSGNMLSVLNIVMQLRKCCNHPNLFEPRAVQSPLCLHQLQFFQPGLVMDLDSKAFGRDLPEIFDLRKRFTGVVSKTVAPTPSIRELEESNNLRPPVVTGFRFHRAVNSGNLISEASSLEIASVVDVSAIELRREGFTHNEKVFVVNGEDSESTNGCEGGDPIPMRVKVDDGCLVLDVDGSKPTGDTKICKIVTSVNGEKTLREVSNYVGKHTSGGNAPVPVSQVANPAPEAIAAMPGGGASTVILTPTMDEISKSETLQYGHRLKNSDINVHPFLRCSTSVSKETSLTVATALSGFHHSMQNGGTHNFGEMRESLVDLTSRLSPPLKRRRDFSSDRELVTGEFADLVPLTAHDSMQKRNPIFNTSLGRGVVDQSGCMLVHAIKLYILYLHAIRWPSGLISEMNLSINRHKHVVYFYSKDFHSLFHSGSWSA